MTPPRRRVVSEGTRCRGTDIPIPRRILIIQLRRIGDVIFTLPAIQVLRRAFPQARIDFLVEEPADQLVRLAPGRDETLVYDKSRALHWLAEVRRRRYDWVLDFLANGRSLPLTLCSGAAVKAAFQGRWVRRLAYNRLVKATPNAYLVEQKLDILRALGVADASWRYDIRLPAEELRWAQETLKSLGADPRRPLVAMAPASRRETRRWLPERFAEVARALLGQGRDVLLLWGPGELGYVEDIARRTDGGQGPAAPGGQAFSSPGRGHLIIPSDTPLLRLAALIKSAKLVLSVENGPKNLAVALGVPTVNVVGPNNPGSFNPSGDPAHVLIRAEGLECLGCELNHCPTDHECMTTVTAGTVLKPIERLLAQGA
ncbi:MAG: glycosyltransferase family 9 protein [Elusimicrobia bacterium]|nr:glycosyltransferase family 9 protein [Elusimicrobiota bacterium]